jgi:hypothetical protein
MHYDRIHIVVFARKGFDAKGSTMLDHQAEETIVNVRIGIAETSKVVELEVDDPAAFETSLEEAFAADTALLWFEDSKKRRVGIPRDRFGFVEIDQAGNRQAVGFAGS